MEPNSGIKNPNKYIVIVRMEGNWKVKAIQP